MLCQQKDDGINPPPRLFPQVRKHITDLYEDLRDGHNLISLLEVLSGVTLVCFFFFFHLSYTHTCFNTHLSGLTFGAPPSGPSDGLHVSDFVLKSNCFTKPACQEGGSSLTAAWAEPQSG